MVEYTRQLRAGQELDMFVLSRSRVHGLRLGQHTLRFSAIHQDTIEVAYFDDSPITVDGLLTSDFMLNERVKKLLDRLLDQPVD